MSTNSRTDTQDRYTHDDMFSYEDMYSYADSENFKNLTLESNEYKKEKTQSHSLSNPDTKSDYPPKEVKTPAPTPHPSSQRAPQKPHYSSLKSKTKSRYGSRKLKALTPQQIRDIEEERRAQQSVYDFFDKLGLQFTNEGLVLKSGHKINFQFLKKYGLILNFLFFFIIFASFIRFTVWPLIILFILVPPFFVFCLVITAMTNKNNNHPPH